MKLNLLFLLTLIKESWKSANPSGSSNLANDDRLENYTEDRIKKFIQIGYENMTLAILIPLKILANHHGGRILDKGVIGVAINAIRKLLGDRMSDEKYERLVDYSLDESNQMYQMNTMIIQQFYLKSNPSPAKFKRRVLQKH